MIGWSEQHRDQTLGTIVIRHYEQWNNSDWTLKTIVINDDQMLEQW